MKLQRRRFLHLATAWPRCLGGARMSRGRRATRTDRCGWSFPTRPAVRRTSSRASSHKSFRSGWVRQFFVENIGGGGGNIAMGRVAKMPPDGYTLLMVNPSYVVNPTLHREIPYRFENDFDPVSLAVLTTLVIAVHPSVQAQTLKELVAIIKSNPGKYSYASPGTGTPGHLVGEIFPPVARPRPRACAFQQRGPRGWFRGGRSHADLLRLAVARGAAGDRGQAARPCSDEQASDQVRCRTCRPRRRLAIRPSPATTGRALLFRPGHRKRSSLSSIENSSRS